LQPIISHFVEHWNKKHRNITKNRHLYTI
jgi:hypothetical protein